MKKAMKSAVVGKVIVSVLLATLVLASGAYAADWGNINWQQFAGTTLKVITIGMVVTDYGYTPERLAQFEQLTGMKVDREIMSNADRKKALLVDFVAGTGEYDAVSVGGIGQTEQYGLPGYIVPIDTYLNDPKLTDLEWYNLDDYPAPILGATTTSTGKLVSIPFTAEYFLLWYRQDIFNDLGLSIPTDLVDLRKTAEKIDRARRDGRISEYSFIDRTVGTGEGAWSLFCTADRFNTPLFDFNFKISYLTSPQVLEVLEYYTSMCKEYGPPGSSNWNWGDIGLAFRQSRLAMTTAGNASYAYIEDPELSQVAGKVGYAPPPMAPDGKDPLYVWHWGINYASKAKEAAWLFIEWATSPTLMKEMAPDYGCPARKSPYSDPAFLKTMPNKEFADAQAWMLEFGVNPRPLYAHVAYGEVATILAKEMNNIMAGIKTVHQAAEDAENILIKELGYKAWKPYLPSE